MTETHNFRRSLLASVKLTLWAAFFFPSIAHAYVDPGSGSVIVTAVLGVIGAIGYSARKYFYRIKKFFVRNKDEDNK